MIFTRAQDFPRSAKYLREELPKIVNVPRIMNALREIGKLSPNAVALALKPNNPPTLLPNDVPMPINSIVALSWLIPRDKSNRIFLKTGLFEDFEKQAGKHFMTFGRVSVPHGTPGARELSGSFDKRGMIATLRAGKPAADEGQHSLGFYREKKMLLLGACVLGALVDWGMWTREGKENPGAAAEFAVHSYRAVAMF